MSLCNGSTATGSSECSRSSAQGRVNAAAEGSGTKGPMNRLCAMNLAYLQSRLPTLGALLTCIALPLQSDGRAGDRV